MPNPFGGAPSADQAGGRSEASLRSSADPRRPSRRWTAPMNGLYAIKPWYTRRLARLVDLAVARRISPDVFTLVGVAAAGVAAVCVAQGWWIGALPALAARLAGANLDGAVARARGVARPWGFVLNELGDRASDLVIFAGLAWLAAATGGRWRWSPRRPSRPRCRRSCVAGRRGGGRAGGHRRSDAHGIQDDRRQRLSVAAR